MVIRMNKRQRKKQFKKKYGYNPLKFGYAIQLTEQLSNAMKTMSDAVKKIVEQWDKLIENIKTMPEGEFQEKLNGLTPDQAAMAKLIRYGRKNKVGDETD
jgi:hypothetical protein